jgi:hypothetical protein
MVAEHHYAKKHQRGNSPNNEAKERARDKGTPDFAGLHSRQTVQA